MFGSSIAAVGKLAGPMTCPMGGGGGPAGVCGRGFLLYILIFLFGVIGGICLMRFLGGGPCAAAACPMTPPCSAGSAAPPTYASISSISSSYAPNFASAPLASGGLPDGNSANIDEVSATDISAGPSSELVGSASATSATSATATSTTATTATTSTTASCGAPNNNAAEGSTPTAVGAEHELDEDDDL